MLYVFISPRALSEQEEKDLQRIEQEDPIYAEGIRHGWSLLMTGMKYQNAIIKPRIRKRDDMISELNEDFWNQYEDHEFYFTDGTRINPHNEKSS